jgi:hypothetical protein
MQDSGVRNRCAEALGLGNFVNLEDGKKDGVVFLIG